MTKVSNGTIFCDIDGTLVTMTDAQHWNPYHWRGEDEHAVRLLEGVRERITDWHIQGYRIILTTARPESLRKTTMQMLDHFGILYNDLVMNLPQGPRIVINDIDPDQGTSKAIGVDVVRNEGIKDVELP
jgi:hypothetical protein